MPDFACSRTRSRRSTVDPTERAAASAVATRDAPVSAKGPRRERSARAPRFSTPSTASDEGTRIPKPRNTKRRKTTTAAVDAKNARTTRESPPSPNAPAAGAAFASASSTGRLPKSSEALSAFASPSVKPPEMETAPPSMRDWTAGADLTTPSTTTAIRPEEAASSAVTSENFWAPSESKVTSTA